MEIISGNFWNCEKKGISVKKRWKSVKKNQKVSGPGLYKRIFLVQKQPNIQQVSKSVLLNFLVDSLLLFGHVANMAKCNQMRPSAKVFCWCFEDEARKFAECVQIMFKSLKSSQIVQIYRFLKNQLTASRGPPACLGNCHSVPLGDLSFLVSRFLLVFIGFLGSKTGKNQNVRLLMCQTDGVSQYRKYDLNFKHLCNNCEFYTFDTLKETIQCISKLWFVS